MSTDATLAAAPAARTTVIPSGLPVWIVLRGPYFYLVADLLETMRATSGDGTVLQAENTLIERLRSLADRGITSSGEFVAAYTAAMSQITAAAYTGTALSVSGAKVEFTATTPSFTVTLIHDPVHDSAVGQRWKLRLEGKYREFGDLGNRSPAVGAFCKRPIWPGNGENTDFPAALAYQAAECLREHSRQSCG